MQQVHDFNWLGNAFRLSMIGHTSTGENSSTLFFWQYKLFSHVKMKCIDFYKSAFKNKIIVLRVKQDVMNFFYIVTHVNLSIHELLSHSIQQNPK